MNIPSIIKLAIAGVGAILVVFLGIGAFETALVPPAAPLQAAAGLALTSTRVDFPDDNAVYPDGPHADVINDNCLACHSASMALTQPPLSAAQWADEVAKMRNVYKAPIAEADVPAIVDYLTAGSAKLAPEVQ